MIFKKVNKLIKRCGKIVSNSAQILIEKGYNKRDTVLRRKGGHHEQLRDRENTE